MRPQAARKAEPQDGAAPYGGGRSNELVECVVSVGFSVWDTEPRRFELFPWKNGAAPYDGGHSYELVPIRRWPLFTGPIPDYTILYYYSKLYYTTASPKSTPTPLQSVRYPFDSMRCH